MTMEALTPTERDIVFQCMKAMPAVLEEELQTRLGLSLSEFQAVVSSWPVVDDSDQCSDAFLAINNSLNEVCHGLRAAKWIRLIDATEDEVRRVYRKWLDAQHISGGIR